MDEDFNFNYGDETVHHNSYWHKTENTSKRNRNHMMDEIISILRALVNIFDIISDNINNQKLKGEFLWQQM